MLTKTPQTQSSNTRWVNKTLKQFSNSCRWTRCFSSISAVTDHRLKKDQRIGGQLQKHCPPTQPWWSHSLSWQWLFVLKLLHLLKSPNAVFHWTETSRCWGGEMGGGVNGGGGEGLLSLRNDRKSTPSLCVYLFGLLWNMSRWSQNGINNVAKSDRATTVVTISRRKCCEKVTHIKPLVFTSITLWLQLH